MWPALITGAAAVVVAIITGIFNRNLKRLDENNTRQHSESFALLQSLDRRTESIRKEQNRHGWWMVRHQQWHDDHFGAV